MIPSVQGVDSEAEMARGMAVEIVLTDSEREELGQRVRRRKIGRADGSGLSPMVKHLWLRLS